MPRLQVQIWSDIACPWCYVGKRRFEAALERFPERDSVDVHWRAFELDLAAERVLDPNPPYAERLARKYGCSLADAEGMIRNMTATAAAEGLDFHFERIRPGNTFDAHRLLHLAALRGLGDAVKERFLLAYLTEGQPIGDPETLARLALEAGLDEAEVRGLLGSDDFAEDVRADEAEARALGISGVPFFKIGGRRGVAGAHPAEALLQALTAAWAELPVEAVPTEGGVCGPDGCS